MKNKKLFTSFLLLIALSVRAQETKPVMDTASRKTAMAVCNCLSQQNIEKVTAEDEMQQLFLKCIIDSASGLFSDILQKEDPTTAGEELGKKLAMDLVNTGCPPFMRLAVKVAAANKQMNVDNKRQAAEDAKTVEGTVINVEEKDFVYINIRSKANREYRFIYLSYVPGSDAWIKNTSLLKQKKVRVEWAETEVFQPKAKLFTQLKQIKKLTVL